MVKTSPFGLGSPRGGMSPRVQLQQLERLRSMHDADVDAATRDLARFDLDLAGLQKRRPKVADTTQRALSLKLACDEDDLEDAEEGS